jgi:transglutaminase-like putative cysteine protease
MTRRFALPWKLSDAPAPGSAPETGSQPPHQKGSASEWISRSVAALDIIGLAALVGTRVVHPAVFIFPVAVAALRMLAPRTRPAPAVLFGTLLTFVLGGAAWSFLLKIHPITVAAHTVPLVHPLLWLAPPGAAATGWRIGLGFVELILSAGLTNEFYLPLLVFAFVIAGSVAISCIFLDSELRKRAPKRARETLPRGYIGRIAVQSFSIFVVAGLIFPLLPRMGDDPTNRWDGNRIGYTEEVNIREWTRLSGQSGGNVALRLYPPKDVDLPQLIHLGLIRAKTLELFDGRNWLTSPRLRPVGPEAREPEMPPLESMVQVEAVREPIATDVLPVFYGTRQLTIHSTDGDWSATPLRAGEYSEHRIRDRRSRYTFRFRPYDLKYLRERRELDPALPMHTQVPKSVRTERMERLARRLFTGLRTERQKVDALTTWFRQERLHPSNEESQLPDAHMESEKLTALENFLFVRKEGHCEFFASAAALLLRMGGVPTRLVAGFRLSKASVGGVLNVRSSDAHAWVEVHYADRGWIPLDPTPRVGSEFSPFELLRDFYDLMSGYWFRYVLSYDEQSRSSLGPRWNQLKNSLQKLTAGSAYNQDKRPLSELPLDTLITVLMAVTAVLTGTWLVSRRLSRQRMLGGLHGPEPLRRERERFEKLVQARREAGPLSEQARIAIAQWEASYLQARFGPPRRELDEEVRVLKQLRREVANRLTAA